METCRYDMAFIWDSLEAPVIGTQIYSPVTRHG